MAKYFGFLGVTPNIPWMIWQLAEAQKSDRTVARWETTILGESLGFDQQPGQRVTNAGRCDIFFPDFFLLFFDMFIFSIFFHIFQLTNVIMHIYHILDFRFWIFLKPRLAHQKRGIWANISNISNISLVPEFIAGNEVQQMQRTFARFSPDQPVTFPDCVAKGSRL